MERAELLSFPLFSPLKGKNTKITAEQLAQEIQKGLIYWNVYFWRRCLTICFVFAWPCVWVDVHWAVPNPEKGAIPKCSALLMSLCSGFAEFCVVKHGNKGKDLHGEVTGLQFVWEFWNWCHREKRHWRGTVNEAELGESQVFLLWLKTQLPVS